MSLRLLAIPDAPSRGPLFDLLRTLAAQSLIDPPIHIVSTDATGGLQATLLLANASEETPIPLADFIAKASVERFSITNAILADAIPSGTVEIDATHPCVALACDVQLLAIQAQATDQDVVTTNMVIPAQISASVPSKLNFIGPDHYLNLGWRSVIIAPEVQERSDQATVPVASHEQYIAHAACAIITVLGCWSGSTSEPEIPRTQKTDSWHVLRCRSRAIVAPELPHRVAARIGRSSNSFPQSSDISYQAHPNPASVATQGASWFIDVHELTHRGYVVPRWGTEKVKMGLRDFFKYLWAWITGSMMTVAKERAGLHAENAKKTIKGWAQRALGLDKTSIELTGSNDESESAAKPSSQTTQAVDYKWLAAEPRLWNSLRAVSFGLLDGGPLPPKLLAVMGPGNTRWILAERRFLVPARRGISWRPGASLSDLGLPPTTDRAVDIDWANAWGSVLTERATPPPAETRPPNQATSPSPGSAADTDSSPSKASSEPESVTAAEIKAATEELARFRVGIEGSSASMLWKIASHVKDEFYKATATKEALEKELAAALAKSQADLERERKKAKRTALKKFLMFILAVIAVVLIGVFAIPAIATVLVLSSLLSTVMSGVFYSLAAALFALALWRYIYQWFLADYQMLFFKMSLIDSLKEAVAWEDWQVRRFEAVSIGLRDWADVISAIAHEPFGTSEVLVTPRIRDLDLGLPISHQIREGATQSARLEGLVAAVSSEFIHPGWMTSTYVTAAEYAAADHAMRTGGQTFDPDSVPTPDRINLVAAISSEKSRKFQFLKILQRTYLAIQDGEGFGASAEAEPIDRVFSRAAEAPEAPSEFLAESFLGEPARFNTTLITSNNPIEPERLATQDKTSGGSLPDVPTLRELIDGADPEFPPMVATTWCIEGCVDVPSEALLFITKDETAAAVIDLTNATQRWVPTISEDIGRIARIPESERGEWSLDSNTFPATGELISSASPYRLAPPSGPYSYMIEAGGEPAKPPAGVPMQYAMRSDCISPGGSAMVGRCLQRIADATGVSFQFKGTFTGLPGKDSSIIEIAWAFDDEFKNWERDNGKLSSSSAESGSIGWGGPEAAFIDGSLTITGGMVLLNAEMEGSPHTDIATLHELTMLHELCHALNLGHVDDKREVMYPSVVEGLPIQLGNGDRTGLFTLTS